MRTKMLISLIIAGVLFFAFSTAEASISWVNDPYTPYDAFRYDVSDQGFYVDTISQMPVAINQEQTVSNLQGATDPESGTATATFSQTGLVMESGASGQQLANGASVSAYTDANFDMNDTNKLAIFNGQQTASAFINRKLTVDAAGTYSLTASALAPIDWSGTTTGSVTNSLGYNGGVTLTEYTTASGGATSLNVWSLSLNDLLDPGSPHSISNILLRPLDSEGNSIYYILSVAINNSGILANFNNYDGTLLGSLVGNFNAGTSSNPVTISASLSPAPIPGSVILLLSGLGSLVVLKRKRA